MSYFKQIFRFLSSVSFAILLLLLAALTVIAGTWIESATNSHLLAASWTYAHPLFQLLLFLFFINILFSALRRWPFQVKHIPFLITHLGLLMLILGTMIKQQWGLQGNLSLWEGSGNQDVVIPHSYALTLHPYAQQEETFASSEIALNSLSPGLYYPFHFPSLKCKILAHTPHVEEVFETWIKGQKAYISGFPSFPVHLWNSSQPFPPLLFARAPTDSRMWGLGAIQTTQVELAMQEAYLHNLSLSLQFKQENDASPIILSLKEALQTPLIFSKGSLHFTLDMPSWNKEPPTFPKLHITWLREDSQVKGHFTLPLEGEEALLLQSSSSWILPFFAVELKRAHPALNFIQREDQEVFLFACDGCGRMHVEKFDPSQLKTLVTYDRGFAGYGVQAKIPFPSFPTGKKEKEHARAQALKKQFEEALLQNPPLSPPLQLLKTACQKANVSFSQAWIDFLTEWDAQPHYLFYPASLSPSLELALQQLEWTSVSLYDQQALQWLGLLLDRLETSLEDGQHPLDVLKTIQWPLGSEVERVSEQEMLSLHLVSQQLLSLLPQLPFEPFIFPHSAYDQARLLSAYFRLYGIDYRSFYLTDAQKKEDFTLFKEEHLALPTEVTIETPLTHRLIPKEPPLRMEEHRPGLLLEVQEGQHVQKVMLAYDALGQGLKWPILNGQYLMRFEPKRVALPYRLRLRQARQIFYPQSTQVYSYEGDIWISQQQQDSLAQTLSMNQVYETWEGYRFYLSGVGLSPTQHIHHVQLAVNYDPAKYFLTYPGGLLVFIGIVLLFWVFPYYKKKNRHLM